MSISPYALNIGLPLLRFRSNARSTESLDGVEPISQCEEVLSPRCMLFCDGVRAIRPEQNCGSVFAKVVFLLAFEFVASLAGSIILCHLARLDVSRPKCEQKSKSQQRDVFYRHSCFGYLRESSSFNFG